MTAPTDRQWALLVPLFPVQNRKRGDRPRSDDRKTLEGILWILKTGAQWSEMPRKYGAPVTCWRRLKTCRKTAWETIWLHLLKVLHEKEKLLLDISFLDGSVAPAKKGGAHQER